MRLTIEFALLCLLLAAQLGLHAAVAGRYIFSDELNYMSYGERIHGGQVIYRDFFETHAPGNAFLAALLYGLPDPWLGARLLVGAVQAATTFLIFIIGLRISGKPAALVAAFLYALWEPVFGGMWFVAEPFVSLLFTAAMLCAFLLPKRERAAGLFLWGLFTGAAVVFKLKAGWLALISASFLIWQGMLRRRGDAVAFAGGFVLPVAAVAACLLAQGAAGNAVRNLSAYVIAEASSGYAGFFTLSEFEPYVLLIFAVSFICALAARPPSPKDREGVLLWCWLAAGLLLAFPRFNLFRAAVALPPLALMLAGLVAGETDKRLARGAALLVLLLSAGLACVVVSALTG